MHVVNAEGWQSYEVEAKSEEEAIEKFKKGLGTFQEEQVEVTDCEWDFTSIYKVSDNE